MPFVEIAARDTGVEWREHWRELALGLQKHQPCGQSVLVSCVFLYLVSRVLCGLSIVHLRTAAFSNVSTAALLRHHNIAPETGAAPIQCRRNCAPLAAAGVIPFCRYEASASQAQWRACPCGANETPGVSQTVLGTPHCAIVAGRHHACSQLVAALTSQTSACHRSLLPPPGRDPHKASASHAAIRLIPLQPNR